MAIKPALGVNWLYLDSKESQLILFVSFTFLQDQQSQIDDCDMWCNRWHAINPTLSFNDNNRLGWEALNPLFIIMSKQM